MKIKKLLFFVLIAFQTVFISQVYAASPEIKINIDGTDLKTNARWIDNKVYVPLEDTFEKLGAKVVKSSSGGTYTIETKKYDDIIPGILSKLSKSVVGVVGNLKEDQSGLTDEKYIENIVHGTGIIIKSTGEILTNAHVVENMEKIVVVLSDGTGYEADLKSMDVYADLALIKIPRTNLVPVTFGKESDIVTGKTVLAIGTPISISLMNSATVGVISGVNRSNDSYYRLIQTDAAINPGNSGGPLVNMDGKVIGINSSKYMGYGIEGIGFAIRVNTIEYVLKQFELYGKVKRPYFGADFEEDWIARIGLPSTNGLKLADVENGSPAMKAGLTINDMMTGINNVKINTIVDFNEEMKKYSSGDTINVSIKRGSNYLKKAVKLGYKE